MTHWLLVIPPEGGARQASLNLLHAFQKRFTSPSLHWFDSNKYLSALKSMLKDPDETMAVDLLNQSLIVQCLEHDTTHLFVPALCPITLFTLNLLKKSGIITIHWFIEDYKRAPYWKETIAGYTWFLAVQKGPLQEICEKNGCRFAYLPTAASEKSIASGQQHDQHEPIAEIAIVGLPTSYRVDLLEYLLSQNITLAIAGEGWDAYQGPLLDSVITDKWIDTQQATQIMRSAPIALNLSFSEPGDDYSDFQISPRVYDILAMGSVLVTEELPLLTETVGDCRYHTFKNKEEAAAVIRTVLSEINTDDTRNNLKKNREIIQKKHSWGKRVEEIIEICS